MDKKFLLLIVLVALMSAYAETACMDKDGGKNYEETGTALSYSYDKWTGGNSDSYTDKCNSTTVLVEYYCSGDKVLSQDYRCPKTCSSGRCVDKEIGPACDKFPCGYYGHGKMDVFSNFDVIPSLVSAEYPYEFILEEDEPVTMTVNFSVWIQRSGLSNTLHAYLDGKEVFAKKYTWESNAKPQFARTEKVDLGMITAGKHELEFRADVSSVILSWFTLESAAKKFTPIESPPKSAIFCIDPDGGIDFSTPTILNASHERFPIAPYPMQPIFVRKADMCNDTYTLLEYYCNSQGYYDSAQLRCPKSCRIDTCYEEEIGKACERVPCDYEATGISRQFRQEHLANLLFDEPPQYVSAEYPYEFVMDREEPAIISFDYYIGTRAQHGNWTMYIDVDGKTVYTKDCELTDDQLKRGIYCSGIETITTEVLSEGSHFVEVYLIADNQDLVDSGKISPYAISPGRVRLKKLRVETPTKKISTRFDTYMSPADKKHPSNLIKTLEKSKINPTGNQAQVPETVMTPGPDETQMPEVGNLPEPEEMVSPDTKPKED